MLNAEYDWIKEKSRTNKDAEHLEGCIVGMWLGSSRFLQPIEHTLNSSRCAMWEVDEFLNKWFCKKDEKMRGERLNIIA
jgi:hypothetical protein